jgi:hypothetical protein
MTDYANCPACHGRGVIPLEEARRIEAHKLVTASEAEAERQRRERQLRQDVIAATLEAKRAQAERRLAAIEATLARPAPGPRETAELAARLAKLEAERADGGPS